MKKILITMLACTFIFTGCSNGGGTSSPAANSDESSSSVVSQPSIDSTPPSQPTTAPAIDNLPKVADAAMYRGTISNLSDTGFTLTQADGKDFGASSINFSIDENTKFNVEKDKIADGMYIEVYYGMPMGKAPDYTATQTAIQVNKISDDVKISIYNGEVISIEYKEGSTEEGRILMKPLDSANTNETLFFFSDETNFYINKDSIKAGTKLHIFRSPVETRSLPPQTQAYEISLYEEPSTAK